MNKLSIIGNLTRDPETRTTNNGKTVCNFTVAVNRRRRQGQEQTEADFFRVSAWEKLGEACGKYLAKGRKVCVVGAVQVSTYTAQDGTTRAQMEIPFPEEIEFLSPRENGGDSAVSAASAAGAGNNGGFTPVDPGDDLPF